MGEKIKDLLMKMKIRKRTV